MSRYAAELRDLAEGRTAPEEWLAWWAAHEGDLKRVCKPGVFLRLKPSGAAEDANRGALASQAGACAALDGLGVAYQRSDRYQRGWDEAFERFVREKKAADKVRAERLGPVISGLAQHFPRFARFLKANLDQVEVCEPGLDADAVSTLERELGVTFPPDYRAFLTCVSELMVGDTLQVTSEHPFAHPVLDGDGTLCVADFWLEADGDQALLDLRAGGTGAPVLYYAHSEPAVRPLAKTFTAWVESLPRDLG